MDPQQRLQVTHGQVSAARQAWLAAQGGGATSIGALLHGEVLLARSVWLASVDREAPDEEVQSLFRVYIALVARAGVITEAQTQERA